MYSVSFNEDYWASQPLDDFIAEALKYKWSENDAVVYHAKIRKERGLTETPPVIEIPVKKKPNDTKPDAGKATGDTGAPTGSGEGNDIGE